MEYLPINPLQAAVSITPENFRKPKGFLAFLMFSGCIEKQQHVVMG